MARPHRPGPSRPSWRHLLWWVWPSFPTSWSEVPARLRPAAVQIARLTAAVVIAYVAAELVTPGVLDLTAPLTALLVVQASTVGTLRMGLVRVGAVLTGVLVAVALSNAFGLSWWSLGIVVAASLVLARVLRLGEQSLEAPISAMLILAVSSPNVAGETRIFNTLLGTAVGIGFSLLVPVPIPNARASDAVRGLARSQAALLDEVAQTLGLGPPHPEQVRAWFDWLTSISADSADAATAVFAVEESRRLNPRALTAAKVHPQLRDALDRLDRCLIAVRALIVLMAQAFATDTRTENPTESELGREFAVILDDVANGLRAFGDLVTARAGVNHDYSTAEAEQRTTVIARRAGDVLAELMTLDVDPREHRDLWMLQGSVLAALDAILRQLAPGTSGAQ